MCSHISRHHTAINHLDGLKSAASARSPSGRYVDARQPNTAASQVIESGVRVYLRGGPLVADHTEHLPQLFHGSLTPGALSLLCGLAR